MSLASFSNVTDRAGGRFGLETMTWVLLEQLVNGVGRGRSLKNTIQGEEEEDVTADKSERVTRAKAKVGWLGQCRGAPECPREEDVIGVQGSREVKEAA